MPPAQSLQDAANSENSLEGYAAINSSADHEEIARLAYSFYMERGDAEGSAEQDWLRAEQVVRQRANNASPSRSVSGEMNSRH
jgi:hypothetical protein